MNEGATMRCIPIEEAFITQSVYDAWYDILAGEQAEAGFRMMAGSILARNATTEAVHARLLDLGAGRLRQMDADGVDMAVLSLTAPGIQVVKDAARAHALAAASNDELAAAVRAHPDRFAGLASFAPQDPERAAREVERARGLGLVGLIVNSHTFGRYLDESMFEPLLAAIEASGLPLYLHPREPGPAMLEAYRPHGLYFAHWGFAMEAGLHAMRLIVSGTLDRFPRLKLILGHLGEGLPFWLDRIDNRHAQQVRLGDAKPLRRRPSEYFLENFHITTAGFTSAPALRLCLDRLGPERVMFAADYPYEDAKAAVDFLRTTPLEDGVRAAIAHRNAERLFGLSAVAA
jgi:2,3-dihydroxybenzoate decarboxylase